jgi:hypothetical protein
MPLTATDRSTYEKADSLAQEIMDRLTNRLEAWPNKYGQSLQDVLRDFLHEELLDIARGFDTAFKEQHERLTAED